MKDENKKKLEQFQSENEIINENIKLYRATGEIKYKNIVVTLISNPLRKYVRKRFANFYLYIDELTQEALFIANIYINDSAYDPTKGYSFVSYIKKAVNDACWKNIVSRFTPISFDRKARVSLIKGLNELRIEFPAATDDELIEIYATRTFSFKNKDIAKKVAELKSLYSVFNVSSESTLSANEESGVFENTAYVDYSEEKQQARSKLFDVVRVAIKMQKMKKLSKLEAKAIIVKVVTVLIGEAYTDGELADKLGVSRQSFCRAFGTGRQKLIEFIQGNGTPPDDNNVNRKSN